MFKTAFKYLLLLFCGAIFMCGNALCKETDYFPLQKGAKWNFIYRYCNADYDMSFTVTDTKVVDGMLCFMIEFILDGKLAQRTYFRKTEKELLEVMKDTYDSGNFVQNARFVPVAPLLKFPLKAGKAWTWRGKFGETKIYYNFTVVSEETVEVPAGIFKTIKLEANGRINENTPARFCMWFADGVGVVKETYGVDPDNSVTLLLKNYKIAK